VTQSLYILPRQTASAAENMAMDWLLLEKFPKPESVRLRFYGWAKPAWTFGYSQKWTEADQASGGKAELIRRPTGGGLVDHRQDWTYALVFPAGHPLAQARACVSYQAIHEALADALNKNGTSCQLQALGCDSPDKNFSVCFQEPEPKDVVRIDDGRKIAGAAQKRTRAGLLLQGSIDRPACPEVRDWDEFGAAFAQVLGQELNFTPLLYKDAPWLEGALIEASTRFASADWNQKR